jgi:PERQ amino acid-rich with GYF domain-containing protein
VSPAQKAPWAKDEKKKGKSSGAAISLREIQDAEAKAAETRKANQEKERANRLAVSVSTSSDSKEEAQPFTASWGLPTSQAGGRTNSFTKDVAPSGASPVSPAPPVWTNAGKPATIKKTMKEIQEEEERRKKAVAKETVASAAAKRVYAESKVRLRYCSYADMALMSNIPRWGLLLPLQTPITLG